MTTLLAGAVWLVLGLELQFRLDACRCRARLGAAQEPRIADRTDWWLVVDHRQELQIVF